MSKNYKVYRHPERSEGSGIRFFGCCPQNDGESGRSMVEMLGVLAVIGVLSVAGIAGFKNAMDKNKANTIINEAQKRATLVVPQIQLQNNANPTLTEFTNNNLGYAIFDAKVYTKADNLPEGQFGIKVSGVNKEICQNILNTLGDNTVIRRLSTTDSPKTALTTCGDDNTFLMVYNNDMTTNPVAGEFINDISCSAAGFEWCRVGQYAGSCQEKCCDSCMDGTSCFAGECLCGDQRSPCGDTCCESNEVCDMSSDGSKGCRQVSYCTSNQWCENTEQYCEQKGDYSDSSHTCVKVTRGTCQPIPTYTDVYAWINKEKNLKKHFVRSIAGMTSWSAKNFCQRLTIDGHQGHLVTLETLRSLENCSNVTPDYVNARDKWIYNAFNAESENLGSSYIGIFHVDLEKDCTNGYTQTIESSGYERMYPHLKWLMYSTYPVALCE